MDKAKKQPTPAVGVKLIKGAASTAPLQKSDKITNIPPEGEFNSGDWLSHPYSFEGLQALVEHSTILPQCITAYKNNVCGFGISIDYLDEYKLLSEDEHPEMVEEYDKVQRVINLLSLDADTKDLFGAIVATRERYGIAYVEVVRNLDNEVVEIANIRNPGTVWMTNPLSPYVDVTYYYKGEKLSRRKQFRKFRQEVAGKVRYFKEFGDPRTMDMRTGKYVEQPETIDVKFRANEILALPIGDKPYGEIRWIGQVTGMDGAHRAEALNANYFENGRHTPMLIMIEGGTLSDESFAKMQEYMNEIKGESGQHAFMVLETETRNSLQAGFESENAPKITVKDLSPMLQKDELFQDYIDNARKKVQSAFLLPDLYVGYTSDFNRATAQTAMEVTEKQVFIPYRQELAWIINHRLLAEYQFKYCEISFRAPDVTNPDDQAKILNIVERAGGLTPNEAHRLAGVMMGDTAEDFAEDWGGVPLVVQQALSSKSGGVTESILQQVDERVQDAGQAGNEELVAVMKQVRKALVEIGGGANETDA